MNILIVSQHYPPDFGAVSFRMEALVKELRSRNHTVYVLTAIPHRYHLKEYPSSLIDDSKVVRVPLKFNKSSTYHRVIGFFEFYFRGKRKGRWYSQKNIECVVSTTPYMLEGLLGETLAKKLKAKHVLDVRDLWPETPVHLNKLKPHGIVTKLLRELEKKLYTQTDGIVVTSPGYLEHIKRLANGIPIQTVLNGIDEVMIPKNYVQKPIISRVKVLYAGNIGVAQDLLSFIKEFATLKTDATLECIGEGSQLNVIKTFIKENHVKNIVIKPLMSRSKLKDEYQDADILYLQLHNSPYFNQVIPSKIFEYLASNKPIMYHLEGTVTQYLKNQPDTYGLKSITAREIQEVIDHVKSIKPTPRDLDHLMRVKQTKIYADFIESRGPND